MSKRIRYEDLDIRRDGTIWYDGKPRKFWKTNQGYLETYFDKNAFLVHRLIAEKYIPNPENKRTVNHINGIKTDNRVENLEWSTYSENHKHAYKNGLNNADTLRKFTIKEVNEIREKYNTGNYFQRELANEYGVTQSTISHLINKKTYVD